MAGSLARAEAVAQADAPEKSTKPRFDANSIPGGHLPPLEPTKAEIYNVVFEYGVLIGNFLMIAFIATWYMKKVAWTKDPGEPSPCLSARAARRVNEGNRGTRFLAAFLSGTKSWGPSALCLVCCKARSLPRRRPPPPHRRGPVALDPPAGHARQL